MSKCSIWCNSERHVDAGRGTCWKCKFPAGQEREIACKKKCVINCPEPEKAAQLRDFGELKSDGVDYRGTDHPRYNHIEGEQKDWIAPPGWADIIAGKCKCIQCEYARFQHNIKQMVAIEKRLIKERSADQEAKRKSNEAGYSNFK